MHKPMILGAVLALGTLSVLPATEALNLGGEAHAMRDGERQRAGNRGARRNGDRPRRSNRERRTETAAAQPRRRERAEPRRGRVRVVREHRRDLRDRPFRAPRLRHRFRNDRFCMRPRRIRRRLYRRGWDVFAFQRAGAHFNARAYNPRGHRYALRVHGCDGHIINAHSLEKKRRRGVKKVLRKIRKTFKKIF